MNLDRLLELARKAKEVSSGEWLAKGGYPQPIVAVGPATHIAETVENPDFPATLSEYIAAASPDTIIRLIERVTLAETRVKVAESAKRGCEAMLNVGFAKRSELEARLRAVEEVVKAARVLRLKADGRISDGEKELDEALSAYDEAVKE